MPNFSRGNKPEGLRSVEWKDLTNKAFKHHVVRLSLGTADGAEYAHAGADLPFGVIQDSGTSARFTAATEGVPYCVNSLSGTINIGDPVILDYSNSGGTSGFVKSAFVSSEVLPASGGSGDASYLANKAVPGSLRLNNVGTGNTTMFLGATGTSLHGAGTLGFPADVEVSYTIDQPVLGHSLDSVTTPRELFRVKLAKERYYKNNTNN